jgi:hypothetical protein
VFIDKDDATRELHGKLATEKGYGWWLELYNRFGHGLLPMAEMCRFGDNGALRFRDSSGTSSEIVLSGANPLRVDLKNIRFEVLKTYIGPLPPHTEPRPGDGAMISVYVRASSFPLADQARAFSLLMRRRFRQKRITVKFRTDAYFLTDNVFPILYRFDPPGTPPTREQYERSKTMYCFCDRRGIPCR